MDASVFAGPEPWTMWGNTQQITLQPNAPINPNTNDQNFTLLRVQYKRPETWHWIFQVRFLRGGSATAAGESANLAVWFDVITGIGRSAIRIPFFETLNFGWSGGANPPAGLQLWSTQSVSPRFSPVVLPLTIPEVQAFQVTDQIVGQDITVVANASYTTNVAGAQAAVIEISGQFAPKTHIRPDWLQDEPAKQFSAGEVGGR